MKPLTTFEYIVYSKNADFHGINAFLQKHRFQSTDNRLMAVNAINQIVRENNGNMAILKEIALIHPDKDLFENIATPAVNKGMGMNAAGIGEGEAVAPTPDRESKLKTFLKGHSTLLIISATIVTVALIVKD